MANRKATATAAAAKPAKASNALRAAAIVAKHGLAAAPRLAAAIGNAPASVKRYGAWANSLNPAFANATFTLTAYGRSVAANGGCNGVRGQATAMGLTAVALATAANGGTSATGAAVVAAIIGNPALMAAMLGTKANGVHLTPNSATAAAWAKGYVNGLTRAKHGMATRS